MQLISSKTSYQSLPPMFFSEERVAGFSNPQICALNRDLCAHLGLDIPPPDHNDLLGFLSGQKPFGLSTPLAMAYAGHQFGNFVPQLGDGRALLIAECLDQTGERWDLHLKGAGPTRFSRGGDGFATLGSVIREYLVSEAMHHLGVATTRGLGVLSTGDAVRRQAGFEPGGIFVRAASSHLRVGTFEYAAYHGTPKDLEILLDYAIQRHEPELLGIGDVSARALKFVEAFGQKQLRLISQWQGLGFIHGVMNTDNCSVAGLTIDYGPCAFMDSFKSDKVFSAIDRNGRYAYQNQPAIVFWNMSRLASCLLHLCQTDAPSRRAEFKANLEGVLSQLMHDYPQVWAAVAAAKLGLTADADHQNEVLALMDLWLNHLEAHAIDFTQSFGTLYQMLEDESATKVPNESDAPQNLLKKVQMQGATEASSAADGPFSTGSQGFLERWNHLRRVLGLTTTQSRDLMRTHNPVCIPRNHLVQQAITQAEAGVWSVFHTLHERWKHPYEQRPDDDRFTMPPRDDEVVVRTYCGT